MDHSTLKPGDVVGVDDEQFPGRWIVRKVNPVKVILDPEQGGRGLNCHKFMIVDAPAADAAPVGRPFPVRPEGLRTAALVTLKSKVAEFDAGSLFVVIADRTDKVNVMPLGGDDRGRYWRVPIHSIGAVISPADVTTATPAGA